MLSMDLTTELHPYCLEYVFRKRRGSTIVLVVERLRHLPSRPAGATWQGSVSKGKEQIQRDVAGRR